MSETQKADQYVQMLKESRRVPLMEPIDSDQFYQKHFSEASIYSPYLLKNGHVLDIGSGGGFPGIPLAIMNPSIHFYLLDKRVRCTNFLKEVTDGLPLPNVSVLTMRAEELGKQPFPVDRVIARAVSRIFDILLWSIPVLCEGGLVILGKKPEIEKEATLAKQLPFTLINQIKQPFGLLVIYRLDKNLTQ